MTSWEVNRRAFILLSLSHKDMPELSIVGLPHRKGVGDEGAHEACGAMPFPTKACSSTPSEGAGLNGSQGPRVQDLQYERL